MTDRIKALVRTLLEAVIINGEAGIHNGVMDRKIGYVEDQYSDVEEGLRQLIKLEGDEENFSYSDFAWQLRCSINNDNVESCIYELLDYYECVTKTECDFTEDEIKQLTHSCECP